MGGGYKTEDKGDTLTVTARVSSGGVRYAMPSPSISDFVYAALLYKDGESPVAPSSEDFIKGTKAEDSDKLVFSFQRPDETDGFTLEIFAFKAGTTDFSKDNALLSGKKTGLKVNGDKIEVVETIALSVNKSSTEKGTVALQIKVPNGCTLTIDDTTHFDITDNSPNFIITQKESEIPAGKYSVTFTVKKVDETDDTKEEIIHIFPESINVLPGMCTDTWGGLAKDEAKVITQDMISTTVYVRGKDALWYESYAPSATASDENSGSYLSPLATIQKAVDTIIARNDGTSEYTICVDGTLKYDENTYIGEKGMADFSALAQDLKLTIKALSGTATLDGGARFDADGNVEDGKEGIKNRIIFARPKSGVLNLTLEELRITGAYIIGAYGGGIYFNSPGGELKISNGTAIRGNKASRGGGVYILSSTVKMTNCTVEGNVATDSTSSRGGGIFVDAGKLTMECGTISNCTATAYGGGVYINSAGTFKMSETAKITDCKTTSTDSDTGGGGIYNAGTLTITGGTISDCTSASYGGGVYIYNGGTFTMEGDTSTISGNEASNYGGGVYVAGAFEMRRGTISGNKANYGGGVYVSNSGTFKMSGGTISGNEAKWRCGGVFVGSGSTFKMSGGTISRNEGYGGGVYISTSSSEIGMLNMSGSAQISDGDYVYLDHSEFNIANIATICVTGELTATTPVAIIRPSVYTENRPLLTAGEGVTLSGSICEKFAVTPQSDGTEWRVAFDGTDGTNGVLIRKYEIGETGPGGGTVYYYSADGFTVNGKTCHYLEYSKETIGNSTWCPCTSSSGYCAVTISNAVGAGYANTQAILAHANHSSATASNCAAKACAEYSTDTTTAGEWFLPSYEEAIKMHRGGTITSLETLWYSSNNNNNAGYITVEPGGCGTNAKAKTTVLSVRAVRAF